MKSTIRLIIPVFFFIAYWPRWSAAVSIMESPELHRFIDEMVVKNNLSREDLVRWFNKARIRTEVIEAIERPAENLPWYRYREQFVNRKHARIGADYWRRHAKILNRAQKVYGVPPEIIVAVLGVETRYGKSKGSYRVLDALTTLTLKYPRRKLFFRNELEQYLLLIREEGFDPLSLKGSYAGAIGDPQFLASSYRRYAVDFNGDSKRDLLGNVADVIGSVANYLRQHGWQTGGAIVSDVTVQGAGDIALTSTGMKPQLTIRRLKQNGITPKVSVSENDLVVLIRLQDTSGQIYRLGFHNFYVITRYNRSVHYAMAVYELSGMIRKLYRGRS